MAQRDRNAAAAGLAALGALMYAKSRKEKEEETSTPSAAPAAPAATAAPARDEPDIASMDVPTVPPMGASAAPQQAAGPARQAPVRQATARQAPVRQTTPPAQVVGARVGQGGPSAAEIQAYQDRVSGGARSTGRGGATADELVEYERRKRLMTPGADAIEGVYPEENFLAPGLKTVAGAAKALANRAPKLREYTMQSLGYSPAQLANRPTSLVREEARTARAAQRESEMARDNARAARRAPRAGLEDLPESISMPMKKGGAVKKMASGGVASASKRADGCAARGKTRGKIY